MSILDIHRNLYSTVLIYNVIMLIWSFVIYFRKRSIDSSFWGALAIYATIFIAQGIVGAFMLLRGLSPARGVHTLYGALGVLTIPAVFAYTRGRDTYQEAYAYGWALVFLLGIIIRAATTTTPVG